MKEILHFASIIIGVVGAAIIVWGVILITFRLLKLEFKRFKQKSIYHEREILIGTITHPTLNDMAVLGSIVLIRTVISHFLEREVAEFAPPEKKR